MLAGAIVLFGFGTSAGAVPVSSYNSNASINFTAPDDSPPVLDPTTLTPPYSPGAGDPTDEATGDTGPLTLDYVSSLNFGSHPISASSEEYQSTTLRPFIQLSDRRGTGVGWHVTAQLGSFTNAVSNTLAGATLTLANGEAVSPGNTPAPAPENPVTLIAGGSADTVVNAEEGTGLGTWINRWYPTASGSVTNDSVTLSVPAGTATAGNHSAVITWTLMDAPQ